MNKGLEYYMSLPYPVEICPIPEKEGGGYMAAIPLLGRYAVCADGETAAEAMEALEQVKADRISDYISQGLSIPEPDSSEDKHSGRILLRMPRELHKSLALQAKQSGVSLNQYLVGLLAGATSSHPLKMEILERLSKIESQLQSLGNFICKLEYKKTHIVETVPPAGELYAGDDYELAA